ncbi:Carboxylesterase [Aspergillus coremiiformis]|uniref:Carboxylic ester hydrolase n=1 Tax=Aspergillus coremiiformis TaxID=138285 RepID=A0A5N6Z857_9EURO|nr:Carboxylesterase [Aspergillus coremiiformis]
MEVNPALYLQQGLLGPPHATATALANPTVSIASGVVIGTTLPTTSVAAVPGVANAYLGIPFAKSPPRRFSAPEDHEPWSEPLYAQALTPACPQAVSPNRGSLDSFLDSDAASILPVDEDCLYLNIYAPQDASPSNLKAVLFWIYGGDLNGGAASEPLYNGTSLAVNGDVIVVTINYRINIFGFSNSPEIPIAERNAGFLDQRFALNWVQQNIEQFGGDREKVTIFGESAGGYSVKQLLAIPPSPRPYRAAIMESQQTKLPGNGALNFQKVLDHFNCADIDCLRAVNASDITAFLVQEPTSPLLFPPVADNATFVPDIRDAVRTGSFADVPIIIGTNKDELGPLVFLIMGMAESKGLSLAEALGYALYKLGAPILDILGIISDLASLVDGDLDWPVLSRMMTDIAFTCPSGAIANLTATSTSTWRYRYSASLFPQPSFEGQDVYHGAEIPVVFGTYPRDKETVQMVDLSQYMQQVWTTFAKNPQGGPGWPRVGTGDGPGLADIGGEYNSTGERPIDCWVTDYWCDALLPIAEKLNLAW